MAEKKKPTRNSKTKSTPVQKTLFDLFPSKPNERQDEATSNAETDARNINDNRATELTSVSDVIPPVVSTVPGALHSSTSQEACSKALPARKKDTASPKLYSIFERSDASRKTSALSATHDSEHDVMKIVDHQSVDEPLQSTHASDSSASVSSTTARTHNMNYSDKAVPHTKAAKSVVAPFPSQDLQHVRGPQNSFSSPVLNFGRRTNKKQAISSTDTPKSLASLAMLDECFLHDRSADCVQLLAASNVPDRQNYLETIPSEHIRLHPAIRQLLDAPLPHDSAFSQKTWSDRWRPTRAEQILGNERQALYLRDWLRSLELEFTTNTPDSDVTLPQQDIKAKGKGKVEVKEVKRDLKRPRVVRAVEKNRRKKQRVDSEEEDDWIVATDESSEHDDADGDSEDEYREGALLQNQDTNVAALDQVSDKPSDFQTKLTNTILIAGPPGCGKTAAVYACADELGWEVFEVYPGIGKRSASSLENLVGDVGKNHLVRKSHHHSQTRTLLDQKSGVKAKNNMMPIAIGTEDKPIEIDDGENQGDFGFVGSSPTKLGLEGTRPTTVVQQSMVLLEEVDILFKEDSSFWPAVVNLIKDCKRPVIMTCNDVTLVPTVDLPLQDILTFQSIPPLLAVSYLQSLCVAEGRFIERQQLRRLYDTTYELNAEDQSVVNPSRDGLPVPDLRRSIHQLQFLCSGKAKHCTSTEVQADAVGDSDLLSYADSIVEKPKVVSLSTLDEDELGHVQLSEICSRHEEEIDHVIQGIAPTTTNTNTQSHVAYQHEIREAFRNSVPTMRMSVVCLDYIPWMRVMVSIDDKNAGEGVERPGRMMMTRTRSRSEYVRMISLSEEQRRVMDCTQYMYS